MKRRDTIIEELHRVRENIGKAHDFDVRRIAATIRQHEAENTEASFGIHPSMSPYVVCVDTTQRALVRLSSFDKSCRFIFVRRVSMAFGLYFRPTGFTPAVYDDVIKQLEQAGAGIGKVPGRRFHCAMEVDGAVSVFDVWDSMEQFQKFGETLVPIMKKLGADPGQPQIMKVHNVKNG